MIDSTHLGDGVYVTFSNFGIWLTANHHDLEQCTDKVFLEPYSLEMLVIIAREKGLRFGGDPQ